MTIKFHLHIENSRKRLVLFQIQDEHIVRARARHPALAATLQITNGWDRDLLDTAMTTAQMMISSTPPRERLTERAPRLRWIQTTGAGVDHLLPLDWLPRTITLTNNSGAHGAKCQWYCQMALLMLNQRMPTLIDQQRARQWSAVYTPPPAGEIVVVVGFGDLGRGAARAARALGLTVVAVTRSGAIEPDGAGLFDEVVATAQLDQVLARADYVVLTTPLTPATRNLFDAARFAQIKPDAGFINVGRGGLVDHDALREALTSQHLRGAVIDVADIEPLPSDSALWATKNLVITPHVSCDDPRYIDILLDSWFANFARYVASQPLHNVVDRERGY